MFIPPNTAWVLIPPRLFEKHTSGDAATAAVFWRLFRAVAVVACHVMSSTILVISDTSVGRENKPLLVGGWATPLKNISQLE